MRAVSLVLLALLAGTRSASAARPHVYLVIIDGLDARLATPERMPVLFGLAAREPARTSYLPAVAVMPTRTNPNHTTLVTGVYADAHGIVGNAWWRRVPQAPPEKLDAAELVEVETFFTLIETHRPSLGTMGVFGKPKLARLLGAAPGRQRAPDVLWSPDALPASRRDPASGYSADADTMSAALDAMVAAEPDLAVLNLADVDRSAHASGPDSRACAEAVAGADATIARLVEDLRARDRWRRSVLIVTADHGFDSVAPTAERRAPSIALGDVLAAVGAGGVRFVADGGVAHLYAEDLDGSASAVPPEIGARLARAAAVATATPGVAEVLARLPVADVPLLASVHPDWHLANARSGDLLVVAAPGYQLIDPLDAFASRLLGNHGGPRERAVPLVVSGGWRGLARAGTAVSPPDAAAIGATIAHLLGLRAPRRHDGAPLDPGARGRVLHELLRGEYRHTRAR